jgi:DNA-binding NarL/FixJ family response regulator
MMISRKRKWLIDAPMTDEPSTTVLIAASPGPLRDALQALLLSLPPVRSTRVANSPAETVKTATVYQPGLVIVVMEANHTWAQLPGKIWAVARDCRVIVLANGDSEINGADLVLQQGARPETLVAAFLSLLTD